MADVDDIATDTVTHTREESRHVYPTAAMAGDYLRTAAGLVPTGVLLATVSVSSTAAVILGSFAAIFAVFGVRTFLRHGTRIEVTDNGLLALGPIRRAIPWTELDRMRLAYYSTRKDRNAGWMQLELGAGQTRVRLDSRLERFDDVVRRAAIAAHARNLALNESTVANLEALGIKVPDSGVRP